MIRLSRLKVSRFVDLFNLFNSNAEQNTSYNSGTSFLRPLNIIPPSDRQDRRADYFLTAHCRLEL